MSPPERPAPPTFESVLANLASFLRHHYPDEEPAELHIPFRSGRELRLPWPRSAEGPAACRHSPDFREVVWRGEHYRLTPTQAAIVRVLWSAWEAGTPEVGSAALLEGAGSDATRVRDLFRDAEGKRAWGALLGPTGTGTYRLYEEPEGD